MQSDSQIVDLFDRRFDLVMSHFLRSSVPYTPHGWPGTELCSKRIVKRAGWETPPQIFRLGGWENYQKTIQSRDLTAATIHRIVEVPKKSHVNMSNRRTVKLKRPHVFRAKKVDFAAAHVQRCLDSFWGEGEFSDLDNFGWIYRLQYPQTSS